MESSHEFILFNGALPVIHLKRNILYSRHWHGQLLLQVTFKIGFSWLQKYMFPTLAYSTVLGSLSLDKVVQQIQHCSTLQ